MDIKTIQQEVEVVSAHYGATFEIDRTDDWLVLKLGDEVGELTQAYLARSGQSRSKGRSAAEVEQAFTPEVADVFAQVLLIAERFNIDLQTEIDRKWLVWKPENKTEIHA